MMPVDIDEDTLQKIADMTGGKYYRADNAERFQAIYAEIDKLEKTEAEVKKFAQHRRTVRLGHRARPWAAAARSCSCATRSGGGCHDLRQPPHPLAAAGDPAGAAGLLLVGLAQAAATADAVHPGAPAAGLTVGISAARQKIRVGCLVLAVACLILALARPQWGFDWEEVKQRGLDIVVAIDTSKSMLAEDIAPNRLARANWPRWT